MRYCGRVIGIGVIVEVVSCTIEHIPFLLQELKLMKMGLPDWYVDNLSTRVEPEFKGGYECSCRTHANVSLHYEI